MSRFWEIAFCLPLLFRRHVCLSKLKHSPSRELPLTARKTVFSHLKQLAWPMAERQIGHWKSCLVISARFPVGNWRSHSFAKSA